MNLAELVNSNYNKLNENDLHIVKYILNNKKNCYKMGIIELANKCNVSKSTILRLTQKLGLSGYSEFKIFLKWEDNKNIEEDNDYIENICKSLNDTIKNNDNENIKKICKIIHDSQRIFIYGTGRAQQMYVEEIKRLFLFCHKYFLKEADCQRTFLKIRHFLLQAPRNNPSRVQEVSDARDFSALALRLSSPPQKQAVCRSLR